MLGDLMTSCCSSKSISATSLLLFNVVNTVKGDVDKKDVTDDNVTTRLFNLRNVSSFCCAWAYSKCIWHRVVLPLYSVYHQFPCHRSCDLSFT